MNQKTKKHLFIKELYLLVIIILGLVFLSVYTTYGLFVTSTKNDVTVDSKLIYKFDINSSQTLTLAPGSAMYFTMIVNNNSGTSVYYEIYTNNTNSQVIVAEVVENISVTTTAPNTSGTLAVDGRKEVAMIIVNNSSNTFAIKVGVSTGYKSPITYGTGVFPSGVTNVSDVYALENVPEEYCIAGSCSINSDDCVIVQLKKDDGSFYRTYKCIAELETMPTTPSPLTTTYTTPSTTPSAFVVPITGYYYLELKGASGGSGSASYYSFSYRSAAGGDGGRGGILQVKVYLEAGEILSIYVAGEGSGSGASSGGTGGGGTAGPTSVPGATTCGFDLTTYANYASCLGNNGSDGSTVYDATYVQLIASTTGNSGNGSVTITFDSFAE